MQLFGCQFKAHEFVLKVLVVNTEYQFLGFCSKKNHSHQYGYTIDPGQQEKCSVVWSVTSRVTPPCIDCRGKNKIYEDQAMHTYNINIWDGQGSNLIKMHESHWLETCLGTSP